MSLCQLSRRPQDVPQVDRATDIEGKEENNAPQKVAIETRLIQPTLT